MNNYFVERLKSQNLFLAPLAGISDTAFRQSMREANRINLFAVTEMVSAKALYYKNKNTQDLMLFYDKEKDTGVQIFGSDENALSYAVTEYLNPHECDFIDINFGCPVRKVVSNGEGSALLADLDKLGRVAKSVVRSSVKPVSAKVRLGVDETKINILDTVRVLEDAGISLVSIHARTARQMYSGTCNYEYIARAKEIVNIPLVANGDITSPQKAKQVFDSTGADGIMIGRGALKDPFIFRKVDSFLKTGLQVTVNKSELFEAMRRELNLLIRYKGEETAVREFRTYFAYCTKGLKYSCEQREQVNRTKRAETLFDLIGFYENMIGIDP